MGKKDDCKGMLEASTISDTLCFIWSEKFDIFREKSENYEKLCVWQLCKEFVVQPDKIVELFKNRIKVKTDFDFFSCSCLTIMKHQRKELSWPIKN